MTYINQVDKLKKISFFLRKKIIEISYQAKAHHIGGELSCIDILVALYFKIMNINPKYPEKRNRDFFILSKGHAALALYVTLMKRGFTPAASILIGAGTSYVQSSPPLTHCTLIVTKSFTLA